MRAIKEITYIGFRISDSTRIALVCGLFAFAKVGIAQTWDKFLAPGFTYRMELDLGTPRIIHAIRYSPQSEAVSANPELGHLKVFTEDVAKSRQTIAELVKQTGAIGGVNGDFFPFTGDPLGLMVKNGELMSAPWPNRAVFAWGKHGSAVAVPAVKFSIQSNGLGSIPLDGINEECGPGKVVLNTQAAGFARSKSEATHIVLSGPKPDWSTHSTWEGVVASLVHGTNVPVPQDGAILTIASGRETSLGGLPPGSRIMIDIQENGFEWSQYDQAVGGGPFLVKDGRIAIDWDYEGFKNTFALRRHPRTAVGRTKGGDIWFVTIDGRQAISDGATLEETARIMLRYGCIEAMNLDGGGSTTFNLFGMTLNRPSDGKEREVANGVLFFGPRPQITGRSIEIKAPAKVFLGEAAFLRAVRAGAPVANANVIWLASGAGWIDQGGEVHPTTLGTVTVTAFSEGSVVSAQVQVAEKPKPVRASRKKRGRKGR